MKQKKPLSYIELSKKNLIHNFKALKKIAKNKKIIAVIKGNAYGHGQNEIAKILNPHVDCFQVNSFLELKLLRKVSNKKTFVFGYVEQDNLKEIVKLKCVLSVFSVEELQNINKISRNLKIKQEIHLPIDAFLGREGFLRKDLPKFLKELKRCKYINLTGAYAHFANIEDTTNFSFAKKQIIEYEKAVKLVKNFEHKLQTHISATSGLLVYEKNDGHNTFIRLGIGIYGLWPSEHIKKLFKNELDLKPVLSFKTKVAQIKNLPKGHNVGYGLVYKTSKPTKVAIIPVGYSDGLKRLENGGNVLIKGKKCKILGRVAMNMFVVNITDLKDVHIEDEVVIIGKQGKKEITAEELAEEDNSINYEVVAHLNPLLPRIII
jgi:alanine racemase